MIRTQTINVSFRFNSFLTIEIFSNYVSSFFPLVFIPKIQETFKDKENLDDLFFNRSEPGLRANVLFEKKFLVSGSVDCF